MIVGIDLICLNGFRLDLRRNVFQVNAEEVILQLWQKEAVRILSEKSIKPAKCDVAVQTFLKDDAVQGGVMTLKPQ